MNTLRAVQQAMLQAVMAPAALPPPDVRGDTIASAESRMAIYQHGYRARLHDALGHEFPGLRCMASHYFSPLLYAYIDACPSQHYNIRWHGAGIADFLRHTQPDKPQWAEMAAFDWAISTAFDAADEPMPDPAELSSVPAESWASLRLFLQSNLRLLTGRYNVETFRRAIDKQTSRPRLRRFAAPRHFMVWRHAMTVHYRRLGDDEHDILGAAQRGEPFANLCARLASRHSESTAVPRMVALLQTWLRDGLVKRWQ